MRAIAWTAMLAVAASTFGCGGAAQDEYTAEDRKANGLVIILPGIEGESGYNHDIRQGLAAAGMETAMPIWRWGRPIPLAGLLLNQIDFIGNRFEASKISDMIVRYQDDHPGKPVYLIGHSGGGGVAVFAAEGLPEGRQVNGLVLLSASISSGYDLTKALQRTRQGIVNFRNPNDIALLGIGTTLVGNVDGGRGPSAGLVGFSRPSPRDRVEKLQAYSRLHQIEIDGLIGDGGNAHGSATRSDFVTSYVAPWLMAGNWPAKPEENPADKVASKTDR